MLGFAALFLEHENRRLRGQRGSDETQALAFHPLPYDLVHSDIHRVFDNCHISDVFPPSVDH